MAVRARSPKYGHTSFHRTRDSCTWAFGYIAGGQIVSGYSNRPNKLSHLAHKDDHHRLTPNRGGLGPTPLTTVIVRSEYDKKRAWYRSAANPHVRRRKKEVQRTDIWAVSGNDRTYPSGDLSRGSSRSSLGDTSRECGQPGSS